MKKTHIGSADAQRLRDYQQELQRIFAMYQAVDAEANKFRDGMWARYGLGAADHVDLNTCEIIRAASTLTVVH